MKLSDDLLRELLATFAVEAQEHILAINQHLLILEKEPGGDHSAELLAEIFREAHSLKGAARAVNLDAVGTVSHELESLFGRVRDGQVRASSELFDLVYQTMDALALLIQPGPAGATEAVDVPGLCARLERMGQSPAAARQSLNQPGGTRSRNLAQRLKSSQRPALTSEPRSDNDSPALRSIEEATPVTSEPEQTEPAHSEPEAPPKPAPVLEVPAAPETSSRPRPADDTIRVPIAKLDTLLAEVNELQVARLVAEQRLAELRGLLENVETWETQWRKARPHSRRLQGAAATNGSAPSQELSLLLEFLQRNEDRLRTTRTRLGDLRRQFEADVRRLAQLMADLQDDVRRTRLLPISTVLDNFPRMVRDLARDLGKDVNLMIQGGQTEVDRSVLEQIKDPLTHLLRNCMDHGLEAPAARLAAGKPRAGQLTLSASQQGGSVRIEVADDGAGIDVNRVKESAIKKGIVTAEAAATMSEREALWLIFRSGLSTSPIITDLSGRGVGLDVVRDKIERLNGAIDVQSVPGQGTRFVFSLPLTVATTLCLLTRVGDQTFGLPITNVVRIIRVNPSDIGHAEGHEVIRVDGQPVTLTRLADALGIEAAPLAGGATPKSQLPVIVLASAERRRAFLVDAVQSAQEVIIKSLPEPLLRVRHITGATILGTGEVVVILNVADLLRSTGRSVVGAMTRSQAVAENSARLPVILVADDSMTTRTLEKNILEAAGFQVRVAADGLEAWSILHSAGCDLIVSDVNMPRLDGFELTARVRADDQFKTLPVILVTSLDSREDRERGVHAGADAYIVKGAFDQDVLLATIRQLI